MLLAALLALAERRWREAAAWLVLVALFLGGLAAHAAAVDAVTGPADLASPGWDALRGPAAFVDSIHDATVLKLLPRQLAYFAALLPMIGWAALPGRQSRFALVYFAGMAALMALLARHDNYYWINMILPAYFIGFALVPRGIVLLARTAMAAPNENARPCGRA